MKYENTDNNNGYVDESGQPEHGLS